MNQGTNSVIISVVFLLWRSQHCPDVLRQDLGHGAETMSLRQTSGSSGQAAMHIVQMQQFASVAVWFQGLRCSQTRASFVGTAQTELGSAVAKEKNDTDKVNKAKTGIKHRRCKTGEPLTDLSHDVPRRHPRHEDRDRTRQAGESCGRLPRSDPIAL